MKFNAFEYFWIANTFEYFRVWYFNRILEYSRVFKMHLNTFEYKQKVKIWYFLHDITVFQSIQNGLKVFLKKYSK